jgi:hypothetical protein
LGRNDSICHRCSLFDQAFWVHNSIVTSTTLVTYRALEQVHLHQRYD